jgi:agmatine deiminase
VFEAPFVLEGGAILTDGEGTLVTTEMCLLNPNRNPGMTRDEIEDGLRDYLGVETVVWLPYGMAGDTGPVATDGHVDGVAHYVAPGRLLLLVPADPADEDFAFGRANLARLGEVRDAHGRAIEAIHLLGADGRNAFANCYVANGVVVAPLTGSPQDEAGVAQLQGVFPDREVIGLPAATIGFGGGGPHCITQQVPAASAVS